MATTQKMFLGGVPVIKNYFGEDPIVTAGSFPFPSLSIDWLLLGAGGGGGGASNNDAGGGGAGRFVSSSIDLTVNASITITIGTGGSGVTYPNGQQGGDGGSSTAVILGTTYTAPGGGGGAAGINTLLRNGRSGGSGGGASGTGIGTTSTGGSAVVGTPIAGFGNAAAGNPSGTTPGTAGGGATFRNGSMTWLDGQPYSEGGGNNNESALTQGSGGGGARGQQFASSKAGAPGLFKLRYLGTPRATGGTITQSGGFTFHTFQSGGTFTYTG